MNPLYDTLFAPRPAWFDHAACRGLDTNLWFPTQGGKPPTVALAICAGCPVKADCAEAGRDERHGVWGAKSARARNRTHTAQPCGTVARYNTGCRCPLCVEARSDQRRTRRAEGKVA